MHEFRQFKLVSGEEIVCEILDWEGDQLREGEGEDIIIIRYPLIIKYEPLAVGDDGVPSVARAAVLIPWFLHQMSLGSVQTMNMSHVTAEAVPADSVMHYYNSTIEAMIEDMPPEESTEVDYDDFTDEEETNVTDIFSGKKPPTTIH